MNTFRPFSASLFFVVLSSFVVSQEPDCIRGRYDRVTDDWYFTASRAEGAVGDVVAVDIAVSATNPRKDLAGFSMILCYDSGLLEPLGEPLYTPVFDRLAFSSRFRRLENEWGYRLVENENAAGEPRAILASGSFNDAVAEKLFPSTSELQLFTLFFRVHGTPGETAALDFCDGTFEFGPQRACVDNNLLYIPRAADPDPEEWLYARSTRHVAGEVEVLPGEPTHPDLPDLPPLAKVYPEAPSAEEAQIHFEMTGGFASPGAEEVPVEVYVTSGYEFSGFALSIPFPARYLQLARLDEHTRPGAVLIDNVQGHLSLAMFNSRRRVGAEGERVKIATLHFDVTPEASEVREISATFADFGPPERQYKNFLAIHHLDGRVSGEILPFTAEVSPLRLEAALLRIQSERTYRGDVNLDYELELTDAVVLLGELFLGEEGVICPRAADFDGSGRVDITDPIGILNHLFRDGSRALEKDVICAE